MAMVPEREKPSSEVPAAPVAEELDRWPVIGAKDGISSQIRPNYDSRPHEDRARRNIAYGLIALLFGICFASFATIWWTPIPVEDAMKIVQVLLGLVIALVCAATGFYYGTKSK
jgi:hypothetical protein